MRITPECDRCNGLIPEHLHTNSKPEIPDFLFCEELYRRFQLFDNNKKPTLIDGKLSVSVFSTKQMSCNRSSFSKPEEVLYDIHKNLFEANAGIFSLCVCRISNFKIKRNSDKYRYAARLQREKWKNIPHNKISVNLRSRIRSALKNKSNNCEKLLGITFEELKLYLENKFIDEIKKDIGLNLIVLL